MTVKKRQAITIKIAIVIVFIVTLFFFAYQAINKKPEGAGIIVIEKDGHVYEDYLNEETGFVVRREKNLALHLLLDMLPFSKEAENYERSYAIGQGLSPDEKAKKTNVINYFENTFIDREYIDIKNSLYNIDAKAYVRDGLITFNELLAINNKIYISDDPKILITHTHGSEAFEDSRKNIEEDTITGMGSYLASILAYEYGITVVHDKSSYDTENGEPYRGDSYAKMSEGVSKILEEYPSIDIVIDLHRDGFPADLRLVSEINEKTTAKVMYFNGVCSLNEDGTEQILTDLPNEYLKENLAFSLKMKLATDELYPDLARKIYIKPYRYSLYFKPNSLLIEAGANTNTVEEVKNLIPIIAKTLYDVIS